MLSDEPLKNYLLMKWFSHCTDDEVKTASLRKMDWQGRKGKHKSCKFYVYDTNEIEGLEPNWENGSTTNYSG